MGDYSSLQNHQSMIFDELRNDFYFDAIKKSVSEDSIVLDLGTGLGLHGFMSATSGAKKTYLVDPSPVMKMVNLIAKENGLSNKLICIQKEIEQADLPEKVDIITSVFTGNFLLTEDLLPSLFYAREKYLRHGGTLIPDRAKMEVVPIAAPEYYDKHITSWSNPIYNINYSVMHQFAANSLYHDESDTVNPFFLAEPAELMNMNFMTATEAACRNQIEVKITKNGLCHGWLGWFQIHLGDKWLSTSPLKTQTHWRQIFLPLNQPMRVKAGDKMSFELNRPELGEWTWTVETAETRQRHSTFLSEPITPTDLYKKSEANKAIFSQKGQATLDVLQRLNGTQLTTEIVVQITKDYPALFTNRAQAAQFIKNLVMWYC